VEIWNVKCRVLTGDGIYDETLVLISNI